MNTTFLLHGGMLSVQDERNDGYFRRLTEGLKDGDQAQADITCVNATRDSLLSIFYHFNYRAEEATSKATHNWFTELNADYAAINHFHEKL